MPKRTQIICMHEGKKNDRGEQHSIDPIFARAFLRAYKPRWLRGGTASVRPRDCGGIANLLKEFPEELEICARQGGDVTLIVLADVDDTHENCDALKAKFKSIADASGLSDELFERVVFIFPKDRIENWIEYIKTESTDENKEAPRVSAPDAACAAKELAKMCKNQSKLSEPLPPSLHWSCQNWKALVERMR